MRRGYRVLRDEARSTDQADFPHDTCILPEAEMELLHLLRARGVPSVCESISKEINYAWAVTSGFRTLSNVGNFYFACGGQTFGFNPGFDFFASGGMQLGVFALHKFLHNESVLLPVLECISIYTKLHVDGAVDFLAVNDGKEILMKCVRFHDNKHHIIAATCQALGSLVLNDLIKESISTPALTMELLGLLRRYSSSLSICRATLVPMGFIVTDAQITKTFIANNGVALVMAAMKRFTSDTEVVWHAIGILNALNSKVFDIRLICASHGFNGIPRIVEGLASHLDTEEVAVEGFQLLSRLATIPDAYSVINKCKVLDLAYIAQFAYSGPQHRHTRIEIQKTLHNFQKCTLYDAQELSSRERASRRDVVFYALFVGALLLTSVFSAIDTSSSALVTSLQRSIEQGSWPSQRDGREKHIKRTLSDVSRVNDVWRYLNGPFYQALFASSWYNGDLFASDVDSQLGSIGRSNRLLGGVQLRMLRVNNVTCAVPSDCYPVYDSQHEARSTLARSTGNIDRWTASDDSSSASKQFTGYLGTYPSSGYRFFIPRLSQSNVGDRCGPLCLLNRLEANNWIDKSSRALFVEFNVFNGAEDVHVEVTILFEFSSTGGVMASTQLVPISMNRYGGLFVFSPLFYAEVAQLIGVAWQVKVQVDKLLRYRRYYFVVPTHVTDFFVIILWIVVIISRLCFHVTSSHDQLVALSTDDSFVSIRRNAYFLRRELVASGWCAFLMWWRLLRLGRCLKPLEQILEKFERAESIIESYFVFLAAYALGFAQTGYLLFLTSSDGFGSFGKTIAFTAKSLLHARELPAATQSERVTAWGLLFRLGSVFVMLNIVASILRERFASRLADKQVAAVPDGLSLLELAKRQLNANRHPTSQASLSARLRLAASREFERVQHTTARAFVANSSMELTEFKKVWGLPDTGNGEEAREIQSEGGFASLDGLLINAEDEGRTMDGQLNATSVRCQDALKCLEILQQLRIQHQEDRLGRSNRLRGIQTPSATKEASKVSSTNGLQQDSPSPLEWI